MDRSKWEYKKLCDVALITMGQSPSSDSYNEEGKGLPFFQGNADFGILHPKVRVYCDAPQREANENDILMSVRAPIGAINIANTHCCIGRGLCAITPQERCLDLKYLYYFLISKNGYLNQQGTGSTFKSISKKIIFDLSIPVPSLADQQSISGEIDCLNEMLALKQEQLKEFDKLAQSIFYDMFGDPITNEKGWKIKKLEHVCQKITDGTHNSPVNTEEGEYMYVTAKNIKKDGITLDDITYVSAEVHKVIYARCNPQYGDVLYIKDGVTTGIATINTIKEEFSLLSSVALLKPGNDIVNYYLKAVLNTPSLYVSIRKNMGGAAITRLTITKINSIDIPLPPLALQQQFAEKIQAIEAQKELVKQSIAETQQLLDSRMDYYFN